MAVVNSAIVNRLVFVFSNNNISFFFGCDVKSSVSMQTTALVTSCFIYKLYSYCTLAKMLYFTKCLRHFGPQCHFGDVASCRCTQVATVVKFGNIYAQTTHTFINTVIPGYSNSL